MKPNFFTVSSQCKAHTKLYHSSVTYNTMMTDDDRRFW